MLASATFTDDDPSKRPSVQVGDPFAEKLLIEASLELIEGGLVAGLQDLGAGGITCATSELADRGGTGMLVDLDAIPRREPGMAPFEVMISESQERMCAVVLPERLAEVRAVCARWGLPAEVIGRVTADGDIAIVTGGLTAAGQPGPAAREIARIPARALTSDAIVHDRLAAPPPRRREAPAPGPADLGATGEGLPERGHGPRRGPARPRRRPQPGLPPLGHRPVRRHGPDEHGRRRPGTARPSSGSRARRKALVASTDANQSVGAIDPWLGAALSVAEATRNVAITGARPLGVTNCLNYGDPTRPEAFWQLGEAVRGLGDACRALGLPVTGGNVSLYNESPAGAIAPTPEIGVVGLLQDVALLVGPAFAAEGDAVVLVGEATPGMAGSAYADLAGVAPEDGPPALDLDRERAVQRFIGEAIARRLVASAQDVSGGGLGVALAEAAIWSGVRGPAAAADQRLAGRRAVRREPVPARAQLPAPPRGRAAAPGPPVRPAGRGDRRRGRGAPASSS